MFCFVECWSHGLPSFLISFAYLKSSFHSLQSTPISIPTSFLTSSPSLPQASLQSQVRPMPSDLKRHASLWLLELEQTAVRLAGKVGNRDLHFQLSSHLSLLLVVPNSSLSLSRVVKLYPFNCSESCVSFCQTRSFWPSPLCCLLFSFPSPQSTHPLPLPPLPPLSCAVS